MHSTEAILEEIELQNKTTYQDYADEQSWIPETRFWIKKSDMKSITRRVNADRESALNSYDMAIYDTIYLAGWSINVDKTRDLIAGIKRTLGKLQH